jgi:hypothetical protein
MHSVISRIMFRHSFPVSEYGVNSNRNPGVVPAKAGNQFLNTGFPRIKYRAGLVKPGMIKRKRLMPFCIKLSMKKLTTHATCCNALRRAGPEPIMVQGRPDYVSLFSKRMVFLFSVLA